MLLFVVCFSHVYDTSLSSMVRLRSLHECHVCIVLGLHSLVLE